MKDKMLMGLFGLMVLSIAGAAISYFKMAAATDITSFTVYISMLTVCLSLLMISVATSIILDRTNQLAQFIYKYNVNMLEIGNAQMQLLKDLKEKQVVPIIPKKKILTEEEKALIAKAKELEKQEE